MKKMTRILSCLLAVLLLLGLMGCGENPAETTQQTTQATEPTVNELTPEEKILAERRDIVEQYMCQSVSVVWRADCDVHYVCYGDSMDIVSGRLYSGVPYSHSGGTAASFLEYAKETDEHGIPVVTGLTTAAFQKTDAGTNRIGNDCSSAVALAWSQIGASIGDQGGTGNTIGTNRMIPKYGFIPVGDYEYEVEGDQVTNTKEVILLNGKDKMYECYAQLQKGDAVVRRTGNGHTRMVVSVDVVYDENGKIDPKESRITYLDQTVAHQKGGNTTYVDETLGETVYVIGGVDKRTTFALLLSDGYLPVTCKELIDPSPLAEPVLTDSETELNYETILTGNISCNWFIDAVTMTITDANGQEVQKATVSTNRDSYRNFDMQKFVTDIPETVRGGIDLDALASGNYHCTVVCLLTNGQEVTARDFDFTV